MYNKKVMEYFMNPRNAGEIKDADGVGSFGNPADGDTVNVYIKVKDDGLVDVKFKAFGCPVAIATGSVITEMAKGQDHTRGFKDNQKRCGGKLRRATPNKMECSNLAADALHRAIREYLKKNP